MDEHLRAPQPLKSSALSGQTRSKTPDTLEFDFDIARPSADAMTRLNQQASRILVHHHAYNTTHARPAGLAGGGKDKNTQIVAHGPTLAASGTTKTGDEIVS